MVKTSITAYIQYGDAFQDLPPPTNQTSGFQLSHWLNTYSCSDKKNTNLSSLSTFALFSDFQLLKRSPVGVFHHRPRRPFEPRGLASGPGVAPPGAALARVLRPGAEAAPRWVDAGGENLTPPPHSWGYVWIYRGYRRVYWRLLEHIKIYRNM